LIPADDGFRMHNLGRYVLTKEAPAFVAGSAGRAGHRLRSLSRSRCRPMPTAGWPGSTTYGSVTSTCRSSGNWSICCPSPNGTTFGRRSQAGSRTRPLSRSVHGRVPCG
jgi:hypothetical protein